MSKKLSEKLRKEIVESELDSMFEVLVKDVRSSVDAIAEGSNVSVNGKHIPNSKIAIDAAKNLLALSAILEIFEEE